MNDIAYRNTLTERVLSRVSNRFGPHLLAMMFLAAASAHCAEIIFQEDFESYEAGSNLLGQGGWIEASLDGMSILTVDTNAHLTTKGLTGNPATGLNRQNIVERPIALDYGKVSTLRFSAYARTASPPTHNQSVGFTPLGRASAGAQPDPFGTNYPQAVWSTAANLGSRRWQFSTCTNSFSIVAGYDAPVDMRIVVDGFNNRVYGQYDFGGGLQETPHYKVPPGFIPALTAVHIYIDRRDTIGTSGMEVDNISVTAQSPVKIRPSEMEICWFAEADATYRIDYQSDLSGTNWIVLQECLQGSGALKLVTDKIPAGAGQRFYRVTETNCVAAP